jgi:hypothetical protein
VIELALGIDFQSQKSTSSWITPEYRARQWDFYYRMKELNIRGVRS